MVQVACGQQHTLCRAIDRSMLDSSVNVGSVTTRCDVYAFGNHMLGQLGIGRKGTSKGRLFPTLIPFLHREFPTGTTFVAAGANFSAVIVNDGSVYSFGHAEYNQHGTGTLSHSDYVDPYYYFEPRLVPIIETNPETHSVFRVPMKSLSCGAVFTVGISQAGDLYSWGWNESGVLGHGSYHFSAAPQRITAIGFHKDGSRIAAVVCGTKHVIALTEEPGVPYIYTYRNVLKDSPYYDCVLTIDASNSQVSALSQRFAKGDIQTKAIKCHKAVLAARSSYLRGYIDASLHEMLAVIDLAKSSGNMHFVSNDTPDGLLKIVLSGNHFNANTLKPLVEYLYLNRRHVSMHKRREMLLISKDLFLSDLEENLTLPDMSRADTSVARYVTDIMKIFNNKQYADVVFVVPKNEDKSDGGSAEKKNVEHKDESTIWQEENFEFVLFAHKFIVHRIPYFEKLFTAKFADCIKFVVINVEDSFGAVHEKRMQLIDVSGLALDGVDVDVFKKVILFAYTSQCKEDIHLTTDCEQIREDKDEVLQEMMQLLAAANRLGFSALAQYSERRISLCLAFTSLENVLSCYNFAQYYNLPRLEMQCLNLLKLSGHDEVF